MKKVVITAFLAFLCILFCEAQGIRQGIEQQQQRETQQQQAVEERRRREQQAAEEQRVREEQQRQAAEERRLYEEQQQQAAEEERLRDVELRYQNSIASAERNFNQRQFVQARQDYLTAIELKPESAALFNARIAEIDAKLSEPATLNIYRKRKPLDIFPKRYDILLDNAIVGNSTNNWKTTTTVTTFGTKTISATIDGKNAQVQMNFEPGGVYYIRSDVDSQTRNTGRTRTTTSIFTGKPVTTQETETLYTPILQLVDISLGASEFNSIVIK